MLNTRLRVSSWSFSRRHLNGLNSLGVKWRRNACCIGKHRVMKKTVHWIACIAQFPTLCMEVNIELLLGQAPLSGTLSPHLILERLPSNIHQRSLILLTCIWCSWLDFSGASTPLEACFFLGFESSTDPKCRRTLSQRWPQQGWWTTLSFNIGCKCLWCSYSGRPHISCRGSLSSQMNMCCSHCKDFVLLSYHTLQICLYCFELFRNLRQIVYQPRRCKWTFQAGINCSLELRATLP